MRVLIVEDDDLLRDGLMVGLRLHGFSPDAVAGCIDASAALQDGVFQAVVLDVMLPDGSGLDFLTRIRAAGQDIPVLLLTARDRVHERIRGLDAGADDYLPKPFALEELAARLRAILRRREGRATSVLRWNGLELDPARMRGLKGGREVGFSRHEFTLLQALIERPGAILSKASLEDRLYGWQEDIESNTIEVHIHKLRVKLGAEFIETVRGVGYRLAEEVI
ncbi:response regulator [Rhodobacteraceae bacterium HSP-20]|uniref:Response regulator n=1 Tax=Paragemmobacter amnigenus TaxID=2852097 RepID=A0ABS6J515_9RHOB|nr:response regulator [Rhodobacter amnigenus]MBU9698844.1 response regulator [Rhodobacter amnigenus]MBV4390071.1 response regulator [Rhodobacter amnigenus]